jgi:hypothetical protein
MPILRCLVKLLADDGYMREDVSIRVQLLDCVCAIHDKVAGKGIEGDPVSKITTTVGPLATGTTGSGFGKRLEPRSARSFAKWGTREVHAKRRANNSFTFNKKDWCPGWESNPHEEKSPEDFKSSASAIPPPGRWHNKVNESKGLVQYWSAMSDRVVLIAGAKGGLGSFVTLPGEWRKGCWRTAQRRGERSSRSQFRGAAGGLDAGSGG